jgi:hypothetical protein
MLSLERRRLASFNGSAKSASRLCDEAKPGQILISPRVLMKVENAVQVEPVGEFALKGIRRPLAAYNVVGVGPPAPKVRAAKNQKRLSTHTKSARRIKGKCPATA